MQIVLMYHDIYNCDVNESGFQRERDACYKISIHNFEEHVKTIEEYRKVNNLTKDFLSFTFDDGGKSFFTTVAPILEKYGYKGLFFVSTNYIGTDNFLSESEIVNLHRAGHIIGSHAHTHEHLYTLTDKQVAEEWEQSTQILSKIIGEPITYASIPNGDMSYRVLDSAYKSGIKQIYTSEPTVKVTSYKNMKIIGRYVLLSDSSTSYVMAIISSKTKRLELLLKRAVLKVAKNALGANYLKVKKTLFNK